MFSAAHVPRNNGGMKNAVLSQRVGHTSAGFEGVVVLGCDAMFETVCDSIKSNDCRVIQGMEIEGLMNVLPTVSFPFNISLGLQGITHVMKKESRE